MRNAERPGAISGQGGAHRSDNLRCSVTGICWQAPRKYSAIWSARGATAQSVSLTLGDSDVGPPGFGADEGQLLVTDVSDDLQAAAEGPPYARQRGQLAASSACHQASPSSRRRS